MSYLAARYRLLTQSGAMVDVYIASGVVSFTVPQVGSEDCWFVFDYNEHTGVFTPGGLVPFADDVPG